MSQYTATVPVTISTGGNELNLLAEIRFTHCPAIKETPPSYGCGGEPGEPEGVEDVEVVRLEIDLGLLNNVIPAAEVPKWLTDWIVANVDHADLLDAVPDGPDPDEAYEWLCDEPHRDLLAGWDD